MMGKHSDFRISSFQVVDARLILQFKRKTVWREKRRLFSQAMSSRVSAFVVPSGDHLMSIPDLELGRVKLSYSKFKAKKNLTVSSLRDGECEPMESQFRCS